MEKTTIIERKKDYSISCARFVAMCLIVACHIMQRDDFATDIYGAHISWAFWFNIGVQMFLFISGFLYGKKRIDTVSFYKKAFPKILVDYYVFIIVMLMVIRFSPLLDIGIKGAFKLLTFSGTVPGFGHLWFVPTIMFCYLLTPIVSEIINAIDKRSDIRFWAEAIMLLFIIQISIMIFFKPSDAAWVNCFVIGMLYSRTIERNEKKRKLFNWIIVILCIFIVPIQFRIDYWPHADFPPLVTSIYTAIKQYGHVALGIASVTLIRYIYIKYDNSTKPKDHPLLNWSDKYSYDVYLVHHVFIQSAFGCVEFISNRLIALPVAIVLTVVFSIILYHVSSFLKAKLSVMCQKFQN